MQEPRRQTLSLNAAAIRPRCLAWRAGLGGAALSAALLLGVVGCGGSSSTPDADLFAEAVAFQEKGEYTEAIARYNMLIDDDPRHAGALFNRGVSKLESDDAKGAVADFDAVLAADADDLDARLWRGSAHLAAGDAAKAVSDYSAVIDELPFAPDAYVLRAQAHTEAGDLPGALADADAAVRLNPDDATFYELRAEVLDAMGEPDAAGVDRSLAAVTRRIVAVPDDAEARARRGTVLLVLDEPELALPDLDAAVEALPDNAALRLARGQCYAALNLHAQALIDLTAVMEDRSTTDGVRRQARMSRAAVYEERGAYADAVADYEVLRRGAGAVGTTATLRLARLRAGCPDDAIFRPDQAVALATEALAGFDAIVAAQPELPDPAADAVDPDADEPITVPERLEPADRWLYLDTLAAASLADGSAAEAIAYQQQAVEAAPAEFRAVAQARLDAYREAGAE